MFKTDKIEILKNGTIQVRVLEILELKDGTKRDGGFQRYILTPDTDINLITCDKVKSIAIITWTPEVIEAYKNSLGTESI